MRKDWSMSRNRPLAIGDRFRQIGRGAFGTPLRRVWRVAAINVGTDRMMYARLVMEQDATAVKTIAVNALVDGRQFAPAADATPSSAPSGST